MPLSLIPRTNPWVSTRRWREWLFKGGGSLDPAAYDGEAEGSPPQDDRLLSYTYSQVLAANRGLLLHAAAVLKDKRAFLFFGPSGGGKSTIAWLSRDYEVMADDVAAVRKIKNRFYVFSTPWRQSGFVRTDAKTSGRVSAIFFIKKSRRIRFKPLRPEDALARIVGRQVHFLKYTDMLLAGKIFFTTYDLVKSVPAYEMEFKKDGDFWLKLEDSIDAGL